MSSLTTSLAEYITTNHNAPSYLRYEALFVQYNLPPGYHFINITNGVVYPRGSVIELWAYGYSTIAADPQSSLPYNDYNWASGSFIGDGNGTWVLYLKVHTVPAGSTATITKRYDLPGSYNLTASTQTCDFTEISTFETITKLPSELNYFRSIYFQGSF